MRRIAIINQKGGVGKTTTTANLGAALAIQGRRVVLVDMDAQANLSLALGVEARSGSPTTYSVLGGTESIDACLRATKVPGLRLLPSNIDLSGAELELASAMGREYLLRDALKEWDDAHRKQHKKSAADYVLFDCPPSLGLLSINALAAAGEVLITLQTEFLALQGMSKLVEIVALLKKRLNPDLVVVGILPTLYDIRLKLAREVLGEIRRYFKDQVMPHPIRANVKLAEAPSFGQTIFEYAPDSNGSIDYMHLAHEIILREARDAGLAGLPAFDPTAHLPSTETATAPTTRRMPPPRKKKVVEDVPAQASTKTVHAPAATTSGPALTPAVDAASKETKTKPVSAPAQLAAHPLAAIPSKHDSLTPATPSPKGDAAKKTPALDPTASKVASKSPSPVVPAESPGLTKNTGSSKNTGSTKSLAPTQNTAPTKGTGPTKEMVTTQITTPKKHAVSTHDVTPMAKSPTKSTPSTHAAPSTKAVSAKGMSSNGSHPKNSTDDAAHAKSATTNGAHATPGPTHGAPTKPLRIEAAPTRTQAKTLKPVPRTARVDHIPPLPPDAFEILSTPIDP